MPHLVHSLSILLLFGLWVISIRAPFPVKVPKRHPYVITNIKWLYLSRDQTLQRPFSEVWSKKDPKSPSTQQVLAKQRWETRAAATHVSVSVAFDHDQIHPTFRNMADRHARSPS